MLHLRTFDSFSAAKVCIYEHEAHMQRSDRFTNRPYRILTVTSRFQQQ